MQMNKTKNLKLYFVGAGNIASALISGLIDSGFPSSDIFAYDKDAAKTKALLDQYNINISTDFISVDKGYLFICVKPNDYTNVLLNLKDKISSQAFILSCMAGVPLKKIQEDFSNNACLRFMPNVLVENRSGFIAIVSDSEVLVKGFKNIFSGVGYIQEVSENKFDAITAVAGSGPAWMYSFMSSLIEAGKDNGLNETESKMIVLSLLNGVSNKIEQDTDLDKLIQQVASPGGTTEAGLKVLEEEGLKRIVSSALSKAADRSRELTEENK